MVQIVMTDEALLAKASRVVLDHIVEQDFDEAHKSARRFQILGSDHNFMLFSLLSRTLNLFITKS